MAVMHPWVRHENRVLTQIQKRHAHVVNQQEKHENELRWRFVLDWFKRNSYETILSDNGN